MFAYFVLLISGQKKKEKCWHNFKKSMSWVKIRYLYVKLSRKYERLLLGELHHETVASSTFWHCGLVLGEWLIVIWIVFKAFCHGCHISCRQTFFIDERCNTRLTINETCGFVFICEGLHVLLCATVWGERVDGCNQCI